MTNHYHLLLEISEPEKISSMMASVQRLYTMQYHKRYNSSGYLWQGRFGLKPIQKDTYMQRCGAYIELNPVRAKMTKEAERYKYSSAGYYTSGKEDDIVSEDPLYGDFGDTCEQCQRRYKEYLLEVAGETRQGYTQTEEPLGDEKFKGRLIKRNGRWEPRRKGKRSVSAFTL